MYNIIPLILILLSLGTIIVIVFRKFSVLANIDLDSIQSEREAKFKERIIGNRLKRNYLRYHTKVVRALAPLGTFLNGYFKKNYAKLVEFKDNYQEERAIENFDDNGLKKMFVEIDEYLDAGKDDEAEKTYIKIISQDSRNTRAFRGLGKLYFERKDFSEAKQTLEHAIRLLEKDYEDAVMNKKMIDEPAGALEDKEDLNHILAVAYFDLALVEKAINNYARALSAVGKALAIEGNNPRFLDTKLEISIMNKDKDNARQTLEKLRAVDPENGKLGDLEKAVEDIDNDAEEEN